MVEEAGKDTGAGNSGGSGVSAASEAHVPNGAQVYDNPYDGRSYNLKAWLFDVVIFILDTLFTIFFREIKVRGGHNVPPVGTPTILVCAPHANQFIDPSLVMVTTRKLSRYDKSRQVCFVTAESSLKKKFVSLFGVSTGAIPVPRAQDNLQFVDSRIKIYCPDFNDPTLIKGKYEYESDELEGFDKLFKPKSLLGLPNYLGNAQIAEIIDGRTLRIAAPFKFKSNKKIRALLTEGTNFKYAAKIDNSKVFQNVFNHLHTKGCVGIFPEGGSHDRPSLLPIKAGVAIMALGATAADPSMNVAVVPCGLHYFHRDKFRSRAVLEYGEPIIVDGEMGKRYSQNPRETVSDLLQTITKSLYSVTENAPDFETLMTIQAARRLYQPVRSKTALSLVVEVNRRLLFGYSIFKDDPRVVHLKKMVSAYNSTLDSLGLKDHQVEELKTETKDIIRGVFTLVSRIVRLFVFIALSLPGSILFTPIFISCRWYARKKAQDGLKKSLVKIKGTDLLATWKLLFALVFAPILYITYSLLLVFLYVRNNRWIIRMWVPSNNIFIQFFYFYALLVLTTYSSLKTGEIGMDLFKSLPPLFITLIYPGKKISQLKSMRKQLSAEVTGVCTELGPKVFPNFKSLVKDEYEKEEARKSHDINPAFRYTLSMASQELHESQVPKERSRSSSTSSSEYSASNSLSKVNSRGSLTDIPIFADGRQPSSESDDEIDLTTEDNDGSKISSMIRSKWEHEKND